MISHLAESCSTENIECKSLRGPSPVGLMGHGGSSGSSGSVGPRRVQVGLVRPSSGWATRDWLRGGVCNFTPMSGFVQLLNHQRSEWARDGTPEQVLRTAGSADRKTHSSVAAVRKQRAFHREVQSLAKFKRVGSRLAKSRFEKAPSARASLPTMSSIALETRAVHSR